MLKIVPSANVIVALQGVAVSLPRTPSFASSQLPQQPA